MPGGVRRDGEDTGVPKGVSVSCGRPLGLDGEDWNALASTSYTGFDTQYVAGELRAEWLKTCSGELLKAWCSGEEALEQMLGETDSDGTLEGDVEEEGGWHEKSEGTFNIFCWEMLLVDTDLKS